MAPIRINPHLDLDAREARVVAAHAGKPPARDADAARLLRLGFPNLIVLTEERPRNGLAAARRRLQSLDPVHPPHVPREVAARWIQAFARGVNPFGPDVDAELDAPPPADAGRLRALLERGLVDTAGYAFAHAEAVWTFEAMLGADLVTRVFVEVLQSAPPHAWHARNPNLRSIAQATAMGWVLLRASPPVVADALAALAEARDRVGGREGRATLARAVDFVLGREQPDLASEPERRLRVIHLSDELAAARARHPWRLWICDPQDAWVTGRQPASWALGRLAAEPRWLAQHLSDRWGPLDVPFTEALLAAARALPKKLSRSALTTEVRALFDRLVADLSGCRGDPAAEVRAVGEAAVALVVLKARSGDELPDAHVGHVLAVDGWDPKSTAPLRRLDPTEAELDRWLAAIESALA